MSAYEYRFPIEYDGIAKAFHWLTVILLSAQFIVAWTMPEIHSGIIPSGLINLHFSIGVIIMLLTLVRLGWRLSHPVPLAQDDGPVWQHQVARATHALLYLLLLALPLMGWANVSARGWTIDLFGMVTLPQILPTHSPIGRALGDIHVLSSYLLLILVGLHVLAALYHHFLLRDRTLARMLPRRGQ